MSKSQSLIVRTVSVHAKQHFIINVVSMETSVETSVTSVINSREETAHLTE